MTGGHLRALLAVLLAFLAGLPTSQAPREAVQAAVHGPAAAAPHVVAAPVQHEVRLVVKSTPTWPGAASAGWAVAGSSGAAAAPGPGWFAPADGSPARILEPHVLAIRGRAPPHAGTPSVS
ncbi:hypothetical protein ABZS66_31335 [Dactylosporangium sp. NPDC005572]|uniref:hypothetical protein n=1 Tax=Dactylosporangium sp. NPDC005572 TaxID=3156889 RepID=UPI0033A58FDF